MTDFYITLKLAKALRKIGIKQVSLHYYFKNTGVVKHISDIPQSSDMDKFWISAFMDCELDPYLPDGVILEKKAGAWTAKYKTYTSSDHSIIANAKAGLILILDRKEFIHL